MGRRRRIVGVTEDRMNIDRCYHKTGEFGEADGLSRICQSSPRRRLSRWYRLRFDRAKARMRLESETAAGTLPSEMTSSFRLPTERSSMERRCETASSRSLSRTITRFRLPSSHKPIWSPIAVSRSVSRRPWGSSCRWRWSHRGRIRRYHLHTQGGTGFQRWFRLPRSSRRL